MDNDLQEKTRQLISQLNYFIVHVVLYFFVNIGLILMTFADLASRFWILFVVLVWAVGIIYHGLRVYGVDPFNLKNKKTYVFWSWVLKASSI